jgi:hypothetical protein
VCGDEHRQTWSGGWEHVDLLLIRGYLVQKLHLELILKTLSQIVIVHLQNHHNLLCFYAILADPDYCLSFYATYQYYP